MSQRRENSSARKGAASAGWGGATKDVGADPRRLSRALQVACAGRAVQPHGGHSTEFRNRKQEGNVSS